jgi:hypothetical protein
MIGVKTYYYSTTMLRTGSLAGRVGTVAFRGGDEEENEEET